MRSSSSRACRATTCRRRIPRSAFPGLRAGDRWCLCVGRWREALAAGVAPPVVLAATHEEALAVVPLDDLERHA